MITVLSNCTILNGHEDMVAKENQNIVIEDGVIKEITSETRNGDQNIDLKGKYVTPGLINMHVHLPGSGAPKKKRSDSTKAAKLATSNALMRLITTKMCIGYAQDELYSGVTTIRTVGGLDDYDTKIRDQINMGKLVGPRILASNMGVAIEGGHMAGSVAYPAKDIEDALKWIHKCNEQGVDLIKLMITGGVLDAKVKGEPGELKMTPEMVKACCDEAHKLGLKVAAHVESPAGVKVAVENGVDSIEHGAAISEDVLESFKKHHAFDICTLSPAIPLAHFEKELFGADDIMQYNSQVVENGVIQNAKMCLANNIPVGLGTDTACPFVTHYDMWRELVYFHKLVGVSKAFALYTATLQNATLAGISDITGSIDVGKEADLIVVNENPLENLETLRNPLMVFKKGVKHTKKPRKIEACEKRLDQFLRTL